MIYLPLLKQMLQGTNEKAQGWGSFLVNVVSPTVVVSCVSALMLTNHPLPAARLSWYQKVISHLRRHPTVSNDANVWSKILSSFYLPVSDVTTDAQYGRDLAVKKVNQFGKGEANADIMAFWIVFIPMVVSVLAYIPSSLQYSDSHAMEEGENMMKLRIEGVSYLFGWGSVLCLVFFMIPVTRHSVLLAAIGWSPIHALRIHIWFGYLSFIFMLIHGTMLVPVWFLYYDYPVYQQIIPDKACWTYTWSHDEGRRLHENPSDPLHCAHVFFNWTGLLAAFFFIVLWGSSLHWVRRKNYKWFYTLHVIFGTLTILGTILHMHWFIIYLIPSITYYMASTTPTLVQALASRFRGGVKICQVVLIQGSGGCVEVQLEADASSVAEIHRNPCQFIKLCVPKISLIWHPFDIFKKYSFEDCDESDDHTVRFIFRPVGPFTRQLAEHLTSLQRPVTLVDGFYRGADKTEQAMQHDCITMIAGGIAVSPYLTLIPALFNAMCMSSRTNKTTSIVLHWVVRERGLCDFIVTNYLNSMFQYAEKNLSATIKFSIQIYITGGKKLEESESSSEIKTEMANYLQECNNDVEDASNAAMSKDNDSVKVTDDNGSNQEVGEQIEKACNRGHPLELARMLPGRYSAPVWNIPFFIAFSGATFLGFWFFFSQDPEWDAITSYYDLSYMTWATIYGILMYFAFGLIVEASVLAFRKYWPQPHTDNFRIYTSSVMETNSDVEFDPDRPSPNACIVYHVGRPTEEELFEDARMAAEPGIFMCGPTALTAMVKKIASKENSFYGLTRFCLYDEPYEM